MLGSEMGEDREEEIEDEVSNDLVRCYIDNN
jgi:hypothetical protein